MSEMRTMRSEVDSDIFHQIQLVGGALGLVHSRVSSPILFHIERIENYARCLSKRLEDSSGSYVPVLPNRRLFCGFLRHLFFEHPNISQGQVSLLSSTSHIALLPSCLTIGRCPLCILDKIFHHKTVVGARSVSSFV